MRLLQMVLIGLGILLFGISLLPLSFASLGFLGILADVGPAENRKLGYDLLLFGLPMAITGIVIFAIGAFTYSREVTAQNNQA